MAQPLAGKGQGRMGEEDLARGNRRAQRFGGPGRLRKKVS
jgi:hypothetical protein